MSKGGKKKADEESVILKKIHHVERELAKVAPPKVENEEFTVLQTYSISPDRDTVAGVPRISRIAVTGNGFYFYSALSSAPINTPGAMAVNIAQVEQVDRRFAMYKYWTPLYVKMSVYPHLVDY